MSYTENLVHAHLAHSRGVNILPIECGVRFSHVSEGKIDIAHIPETLHGIYSILSNLSNLLIVLDRKIDEYVRETFHRSVPFNIFMNFTYAAIQTNLSRSKIFYSICISGKKMKRNRLDIFQIPEFLVFRSLAVTELDDNEYRIFVDEELQEIPDCANTAVGVFIGVQIFGFDIESKKCPIISAGKIINCPLSRFWDELGVGTLADVAPAIGDTLLDHGTESARVLPFRDA